MNAAGQIEPAKRIWMTMFFRPVYKDGLIWFSFWSICIFFIIFYSMHHCNILIQIIDGTNSVEVLLTGR